MICTTYIDKQGALCVWNPLATAQRDQVFRRHLPLPILHDQTCTYYWITMQSLPPHPYMMNILTRIKTDEIKMNVDETDNFSRHNVLYIAFFKDDNPGCIFVYFTYPIANKTSHVQLLRLR